MSKICSSNANVSVPTAKNCSSIRKGKYCSGRGFVPKPEDVAASNQYLEGEDGSTSHDASTLVSSQSVACEVVWDCVSPGPPISNHDGDSSSTPGNGYAPRRLRKRSLPQRTPARPLHLPAAKAKKTAVLDNEADTALSVAKCTARLLFFKNAMPSHDEDVTPPLVEQDEEEAMDIMELSPIACLSGVEAAVAAADDDTSVQGGGADAPETPPTVAAAPGTPPAAAAAQDTPPSAPAAAFTAGTPQTTPKMNQSFSCKNSASRSHCNGPRLDSFDDDSLFSESIIQSTQAIEEALFDKTKNRFISPAAVGKVLSKIQPSLASAKLSEVKQCTTPPSHHDNMSKGVKCRTVGRISSSNHTRDITKPSLKQDSIKTVDKRPNQSMETSTRTRNQQKEADKLKVDASHLLSKPLLSKGSNDKLALSANNGNVVNTNIVNNIRELSDCSSGYRSGSSSSGDAVGSAANISNRKPNERNSTSSNSNFATSGTAIATKSSVIKVATTSAGGRNGHNLSKMPRSRSVYSAAGVETTALVGVATAVRRVNSDSAVLNFSDSDPEFDEIASSIPDNEEMLMPWSQQLLQKTRLKLNRNKNMQKQLSCIQEVLNKSLQRSGSVGDGLGSPQLPKPVTNHTGKDETRNSSTGLPCYSETKSVPGQPTATVPPQLLDDADFFDDAFEMEEDELNKFVSQVEEEYVSASQAVSAADPPKASGGAGQQIGTTNSTDSACLLNNRKNSSVGTSGDRKHVNANSINQINHSGVTLHNNFKNVSNTSKVPINVFSSTSNNPRTNLNDIPSSQSVTSCTNNQYESTPNKKYSFRTHSNRKDSSAITPKNLTNIGLKNVEAAPLSRERSTTHCTEARVSRASASVVPDPGVGYIPRPPTATTTQSVSAAVTTRPSNPTSGATAAVLCPVPAASSLRGIVAGTSRAAPSSTTPRFPVPTTICSGPVGAAPGHRTKYTKEQIAMKKAQAIERQKALLQRKAKGST